MANNTKSRKSADLSSLSVCHENGCSFLVLKRTNYCRVHTIWERADPGSKIDSDGKKICALKQCTNFAQRKSELCKTHNRFKLCKKVNCPKRALRYDEFCSDHGGGKRCSISGCDNIVRSKGLCIGHGGGKRCNVAECPNSAVGSTGVCKAHGAGKIIKENKPEQLPHVAIPPKNLPIMERLRIINAQRALEHERESICKERGCQMLVVEKSKYCESHSRQRGDKERGAKRRRTSVSSSEQVNGKDDHSRQSSTKQCKVKGCNGFALNKNLLCKIHTRSRSCRIKSCPRRSMRFGDFCSDHCGFKSTCPPNSGVQIHPNPSTDTPTTPSQAQEACRVTPYENNNGVHQKNFYDITHSTKSDTESFLKSAARNLVAMHQTQIL